MNAFTNSWSISDLKIMVTTITATLLAGAIAWGISKLFAKKPKLIWYHNQKFLDVKLESNSRSTLRLHTLKIENIGQSTALDVLIAFPLLETEMNISIYQRKWWSIDYISKKFDRPNCNHSNREAETIVEFRRLEVGEIIEIIYCTTKGDSDPKGVSFDEGAVEKISEPIWFMNKRRLYKSILLGSAATPFFAGLAIAVIFNFLASLLESTK